MHYHILNGDALKAMFPDLPGQVLVAREALVDGSVHGATPEELWETRANWLAEAAPEETEAGYYAKAVPEFKQMQAIPAGSEVHLWFERDLFCQVNLWFVWWLMRRENKAHRYHLVLPTAELQYGFGGMSKEALKEAWENRREVGAEEWGAWAELWPAYQAGDRAKMAEVAGKLGGKWDFLAPAMAAWEAMHPADGSPGRPTQTLLALREELQTEEFGPVFREFCRREAIYGFGDLTVYRLWKNLPPSNP